jgi:hypothetical protein
MKHILPFLCAYFVLAGSAWSLRLQDRMDSVHELALENRRAALPSLSDPFGIPETARVVVETSRATAHAGMPWKRNIVSTVFWVGEEPAENNPTPNNKSAWDVNWQENFGGYDHPEKRSGWGPEGFTPRLNPFYIALPYNDVAPGGVHRPEAPTVIPWFWEAYRGDGISVCKGRWVAIHFEGRVCYAQWEDVGPFEVDHWQYVFGKEKPRVNRNKGAGIDLSPAARDYLQIRSGQSVEWRFVETNRVPHGPWLDWTGAGGLPEF